MKLYSLLTLISTFLVISTFAQTPKVDEILKITPVSVKKYEIDSIHASQFALKMDYGASAILNPDTLFKKLKDKKVTKVELIYTDFSRSKTFSQPKLNRDRLRGLYYLNREMFKDNNVEWIAVAQTGAGSVVEGNDLFHGFVITYSDIERTYLEELLAKDELPDSTVLTVFERNKQWNKMLVVADLTGSMSPYIAQVMLWLKLNDSQKRAEHFTFFNDGDYKGTEEKIIGETGGIYHSKSKKFDDILALAKETMANGYGGDDPENDVEAILEGLTQCVTCEDIVIIADNKADMRDLELMVKVVKPVKVIVCGSDGTLNTQYLDLARATGGSIHTIEEDITDLVKLSEGESVKIGKYSYVIKNGKFVKVGKM